jgi:hypothetical protein
MSPNMTEEEPVSRVVHFEIQADDLERAKAFYTAVFDWSFVDYGQFMDTPYWGIVTGPDDEPGIDGGLLLRSAPAPSAGQGANGFICTMEVSDYDVTERLVLDAGGQEVLPKTALTGIAWQGYYLNPEGNTFGIHQPDPQAGQP